MADLLSTLQLLAGGREGCFEGAAAKVDAVAVCHEVRSVELAADESFRVSFKVLNRRHAAGDDRLLTQGEQLSLKSLQLDSVVRMSVWAVGGSGQDGRAAPRACGEVRIPIRQLVSKCDGTLYQTWVALDSPGLNDSVASIGLLDAAQDAGDAFAQAMNNAPRQLSQPKACISLCRVDSLGPTGQVAWTPDISRKDRATRWGPLLRSQQQHVVLCTAQHLHGIQAQEQRGARPAGPLEELRQRTEAQGRELEALRAQLLSTSAQAKFEPPPRGKSAASEEAKEEQALAMRLEEELIGLREELAKVGDEANAKIDAANSRIRALRQERDDALRDVEQAGAAAQRLKDAWHAANSDKGVLVAQKEALTKIVEDLHEACTGAGVELTPAARRSIDSLRSLRFP